MQLHAADPADDFCLYGIAQEHAAAGDLPRAIHWFERLLAAHPAHAYGHYHFARALQRAGRDADAAEALRRGLAAARAAGDAKAVGELAAFLDELTP